MGMFALYLLGQPDLKVTGTWDDPFDILTTGEQARGNNIVYNIQNYHFQI